jgi:hypothetical protein
MEGAMMRRLTLFCCCTAFVLVGCAKADDQTTVDTAAGTAAATTVAPAPITVADVAGKWTVRAVPESGADTTPTISEINITTDTSRWTMTLPNRPAIKSRLVAIAGDSIVTQAGPYASVRRKGVQVTTNSVMRLQDGKLVGTTVAHYKTTGADSVLRFRTEATRAP